jgi:hypothetical protein
MAFRSSRNTVGGIAVQIVDAVAGDVEAWVAVVTGTGADSVFLGGDSSVTTSTGFRLENNDNVLNVRVRPGDELWAISTGSYSVHTLIRSA